METVSVQKEVKTSRTFTMSFHFQGDSRNCTVFKKSGSESSLNCGSVKANLVCNPSTKTVDLSLRFLIMKPEFLEHGERYIIGIDAEANYDVSDFINEGNWITGGDGKTAKKMSKTTDFRFPNKVNEANYHFSIENYGGCFNSIVLKQFNSGRHASSNPKRPPSSRFHNNILPGLKGLPQKTGQILSNINVPQPWLPVEKMTVMAGIRSLEKDELGKICVQGKVQFTLERTDLVTTNMPLTMGSETKITKFSPCVDGVLGAGYDITMNYADANSCKARVFDYKKMNEYCLVRKSGNDKADFNSFFGEGREEYTKSMEKSLRVKVAAGAFGASFSSETSGTFSEKEELKSSYKFATQRLVHVNETYSVPGCTVPSQLLGFLTDEFLSDLKVLSADALVSKYGTHVVLGMCVGARIFFNMSYEESSTRKSKASSFSETAKVSYNHDGGVSKSNSGFGAKSMAENVYDDLKNGTLTADGLKAYAEYMKVAKSTTPEKAIKNNEEGKAPTTGAEAEVAYSESTAISSLREDKSTRIKCTGCGGDSAKLAKLTRENDLSRYDDWAESWNENNFVFCEFPEDTLIPIYEVIPAGYPLNAQQVKVAWENYQIKKNVLSIPSFKSTTRESFNTKGNSRNTDNLQGDNEMRTVSGKTTWWRLTVELLNFDDGHCGYGVSLLVKEYGKSGTETILLNHSTNDISLDGLCSQMAIDTDRLDGKATFQAEGELVGKCNDWVDITDYEQVRSGLGKVLDCVNDRVYIHVDDKGGDDRSHVGVKGTVIVPWLGY